MTSLFGSGFHKSIMLFLVYTILLSPLLGFANADVGRKPTPLQFNPRVEEAIKLQVKNLTASTTPAAPHQLDYNISARADQDLWNRRMTKGRQLYCTMQDSLELTIQKNGGVTQEAPVNSVYALYTEGYRRYVVEDPDDEEAQPYFAENIDEPIMFIGVDVYDPDEDMPVLVRHEHTASGFSLVDSDDWSARQQTYRVVNPTGADWQNLINCDPGAIIADNNRSPASKGFVKDAVGSPRIWTWSDYVFLAYKLVCPNWDDFEWVLRAGIVNAETTILVKMALRAMGLTVVPIWGGRVTLYPDQDPFFPVLGSLNGAGVGFLLNTHKDGLHGMGVRTVKSITIWSYSENEPHPITDPGRDIYNDDICLLFEIGVVAVPNPPV